MDSTAVEKFESFFTQFIEDRKQSTSLPSSRGTMAGMRDRVFAWGEETKSAEAAAVAAVNNYLHSVEGQYSPEEKDEMVNFARHQLRDYIVWVQKYS